MDTSIAATEVEKIESSVVVEVAPDKDPQPTTPALDKSDEQVGEEEEEEEEGGGGEDDEDGMVQTDDEDSDGAVKFVTPTNQQTGKPVAFYRISYVKGVSMAILRSLLQKAIRRGQKSLAMMAAFGMLASDAIENLFNRLMIISIEDIGFANINVFLHMVECRAKYKKVRAVSKSDWRELKNNQEIRELVWSIVSIMCDSPKSRMCDHVGISLLSPLTKSMKLPPAAMALVTPLMRTIAKAVIANNKDFLKLPTQELDNNEKLASVESSLRAMAHETFGTTMLYLAGLAIIDTPFGRECVASAIPVVVPVVDVRAGAIQEAKRVQQLATDDGPEVVIPEWANDMHTNGDHSVESIMSFVTTEHTALAPVVPFTDPYFPITKAWGVAARHQIWVDTKKSIKEKTKATRESNSQKEGDKKKKGHHHSKKHHSKKHHSKKHHSKKHHSKKHHKQHHPKVQAERDDETDDRSDDDSSSSDDDSDSSDDDKIKTKRSNHHMKEKKHHKKHKRPDTSDSDKSSSDDEDTDSDEDVKQSKHKKRRHRHGKEPLAKKIPKKTMAAAAAAAKDSDQSDTDDTSSNDEDDVGTSSDSETSEQSDS